MMPIIPSWSIVGAALNISYFCLYSMVDGSLNKSVIRAVFW